MVDKRPKIRIACDRRVRSGYLPPDQIERLERLADWEWFECEGGGIYAVKEDPEKSAALAGKLGDIEALILCHGAPRIDSALMDRAPGLKIVGELEGDRFAARIDLEAAWERGDSTSNTGWTMKVRK